MLLASAWTRPSTTTAWPRVDISLQTGLLAAAAAGVLSGCLVCVCGLASMASVTKHACAPLLPFISKMYIVLWTCQMQLNQVTILWTCSHEIFWTFKFSWIFSSSVPWHFWLGGRKGIRPIKIKWWGVGVVMCLDYEVQTCIWPSWCHCHSLSLASVKSRLVLPFWYRLTQHWTGVCMCVFWR